MGHADQRGHRIDRFVEELVATGNATEAARRVGYSPNSAKVRASELLAQPDVKAKVDERRQELIRRYRADAENTIGTLASMSFFDPLDFFVEGQLRNLDAVSERARMALAAFKVRRVRSNPDGALEEIIEIRFLDRGANVERLMKHLGLFEKDNRQNKPDPIAELLAYVAEHGAPLAVRPRP